MKPTRVGITKPMETLLVSRAPVLMPARSEFKESRQSIVRFPVTFAISSRPQSPSSRSSSPPAIATDHGVVQPESRKLQALEEDIEKVMIRLKWSLLFVSWRNIVTHRKSNYFLAKTLGLVPGNMEHGKKVNVFSLMRKIRNIYTCYRPFATWESRKSPIKWEVQN